MKSFLPNEMLMNYARALVSLRFRTRIAGELLRLFLRGASV